MKESIIFPHCDNRILHAPGECRFCDLHPDWQELRKVWNIAFTNQEPENGQTLCPARAARGHMVNGWGGNRPTPPQKTEWLVKVTAVNLYYQVSTVSDPFQRYQFVANRNMADRYPTMESCASACDYLSRSLGLPLEPYGVTAL